MDGMVECTALLECCRTAAHTIGGRRSAYVEGYEGDRRYTRGLDGTVGIGGGWKMIFIRRGHARLEATENGGTGGRRPVCRSATGEGTEEGPDQIKGKGGRRPRLK
jgi:hypothetical protein